MLECREQEITAPEEDGYGIAWHDTGNGRALHIINYSYDSDSHRIRNLPELCFRLGEKRGGWDVSVLSRKIHCWRFHTDSRHWK